MEKRMKRRLCLTVMAALMLLVLTGCYHPASRGELIEWFQETYTDAPLVVSREWVEGRGRGGSYEAYLKDKPDLVFHLESKWVYVGEHAEYHNATDFSRVYGEYYLAEYQIERPLQYWQVVKDHWDQESFTLETVYDNPEGLEAAAAELLDFHAFLAEQCPEADVRYLFTFRSPVCPDRPSVSLGSGVVYLSAGAGDGAIRQEIGDLTAELAVWSVSYGLHPEWFSLEEMEAALDYTQTPEYDGQNIYIGAWLVSDPERGDLRVPLTRPESERYTFAEIYRLLEALEWETLEGTETDFSFTGADGSLYALSYDLWEDEYGHMLSRCTKDGEPPQNCPDDGTFPIWWSLEEMTGLEFQTGNEPTITYRGPGPDGIVELPSGPGEELP